MAEGRVGARVEDRGPQIAFAARGEVPERIDARKDPYKVPSFDRCLDCTSPYPKGTKLRIAHASGLAPRPLPHPFNGARYIHYMYGAPLTLDSPPSWPKLRTRSAWQAPGRWGVGSPNSLASPAPGRSCTTRSRAPSSVASSKSRVTSRAGPIGDAGARTTPRPPSSDSSP